MSSFRRRIAPRYSAATSNMGTGDRVQVSFSNRRCLRYSRGVQPTSLRKASFRVRGLPKPTSRTVRAAYERQCSAWRPDAGRFCGMNIPFLHPAPPVDSLPAVVLVALPDPEPVVFARRVVPSGHRLRAQRLTRSDKWLFFNATENTSPATPATASEPPVCGGHKLISGSHFFPLASHRQPVAFCLAPRTGSLALPADCPNVGPAATCGSHVVDRMPRAGCRPCC